MDKKYKILLGTEGVKGSSNEDIYINLELTQSVTDLKPERYDNTFDVSAQFDAENNNSRDFIIYGVTDSNVADCDNLSIECYSNSGATGLSGLLQTVQTSPLAYNGTNVFGKKRGKYILSLSSYTDTYVYLKIPSDGAPNYDYTDQIYQQQVIFYDADNNFIPYGNQTIEIDQSGNTITIDNNFYFLYNKHWIRNDLDITWTQPNIVSFGSGSTILTINQGQSSTFAFTVGLSSPSTFGIEQVTLDVLSDSLPLSQMTITENNITPVTIPYTLSFSANEQYKTFYITVPENSQQFLLENVIFTLNNYNQYVLSGTPNIFTVYVNGNTPRSMAVFNFQDIFNNRNYFTGWEGYYYNLNYNLFSQPFYSVLRNGLFFDGTPLEFYPNDTFNLSITNLGISTILPASGNSALNIINDYVFNAGSTLNFNINTQYSAATTNSIQLKFQYNTSQTATINYNSYYSGMTINSVPIIKYKLNYNFNYETILQALQGTSSLDGYQYSLGSIDKPFSVISNSNDLTIILTAKNAGTRLDFGGYGIFSTISHTGGVIPGVVTATTITSYSTGATQIPLQIALGANSNNNGSCNYEFSISKNGYKTLTFSSNVNASNVNIPSYFLVSAYNNMLRNWNNANSKVVYVNQGVSDNWTNIPIAAKTYGMYNVGDAYINGIVLCSDAYNNNTSNNNQYSTGGGVLNLTNYGNSAGSFIAEFLPTPLNSILETSSFLSPITTNQTGYLLMTDGPNTLTTTQAFRSFDFGTGNTPTILTYFGEWHDSYTPINAYNFWSNIGTSNVFISGVTQITPTKLNSPIKTVFQKLGINILTEPQITFTDYTAVVNTIPVTINNASSIVQFSSTTTGVPYVIKNVIDFENGNGSNILNPPAFTYFETIPNLIQNVSVNPANNRLGGYTVIEP